MSKTVNNLKHRLTMRVSLQEGVYYLKHSMFRSSAVQREPRNFGNTLIQLKRELSLTDD